ncbi:MAG: DMT family transporter [Neomegalonema sp.]|nr:DMT family transporter [Neomegalonema sp.]
MDARGGTHSQLAGGGVAIGVSFMLLATFFLPTMDAFIKELSTRGYTSAQLAWARYIGQSLILLVVFAPRLRQIARTQHLKLQLIRSFFLLGATLSFFTALLKLEIGDAVAMMFAAPLIVTALAGPVLGEQVGPWRWSAVIVGFCGMLLIVRPGAESFSWYSIGAVLGAAFYALYQISTRWLSSSERPETTLFYSALVGAAALSVAAPFFWITPSWEDVGLMTAAALSGTLGHLFIILAMRAAPASLLSPFTYASLFWALLYGVIFFGTLPDTLTFVGVAIVVAAGLVILWRERQNAAARRALG